MSKAHVNYIKKNMVRTINNHSDRNYTGVTFGHKEYLGGDACFARLNSRLGECKSKKKSLQYLLRYDEKRKLFDYDSLFRELRKLFGAYFKIRKYSTHRDNVKIVDIVEIKEFESETLRFCSWNILLVLFRSFDKEYFGKWAAFGKTLSKETFPIDSLHDLIYSFYKIISPMGHGINDVIAYFKKLSKTPAGEVLFKNSITNYLDIILLAFGGEFKYGKKDIENLENFGKGFMGRYYGLSQTPAFSIIEKTIKGASK